MSETAVQSVLVIDDEVNVVNAIKRTLRSEAYEVQVSTDPKEALEIARRIKPVAVVCDMRMPGMSGSEVLAELHRDQPDCARILLTGYADITSTIAAINEGQIHRYLTKPWNDDELRDVLRQQIELVTLRRERDQLADSLAVKVDELQTLNQELDQRVAARTQEIYQTNLFLENAYKELHDQFLNSVKVFSNLIEMSSPAMAGHGKRVAELARWIAVEMGLPEAEVEDIYVAGLLHDIGKIGIPDHVLVKPGPLTDAEWEIMKTHTTLGRDTIQHAEDALGMPVLGHCLGGQLLARALGGHVATLPEPEIGWWPIVVAHSAEAQDWLGPPGAAMVYQWHYDSFVALPPGAQVLAGSAVCAHQAFGLRQHLGMQFHIEITPAKVDDWLDHPGEGYAPALARCPHSVQSEPDMRAATALHLAGSQAMARHIYTRWLGGA